MIASPKQRQQQRRPDGLHHHQQGIRNQWRRGVDLHHAEAADDDSAVREALNALSEEEVSSRADLDRIRVLTDIFRKRRAAHASAYKGGRAVAIIAPQPGRRMMEPDALKVLIYATSGSRLLSFSTDRTFPTLLWQVPGGTVEPEEDVAEAAVREFVEETGLTPPNPLIPLAVHDYRFFAETGGIIWHRRHYYHVELVDGSHAETLLPSPDDAVQRRQPHQFRFFWIDFAQAKTRSATAWNTACQ